MPSSASSGARGLAKVAVPTSTALASHLFRVNHAYLSVRRKVSIRQEGELDRPQ